MKLVEILARDLKAWPKNHRGNDGITQDKGGRLNSLDAGCEPSFCEVDKCWEARSHSYLGESLEEAEDFATAVVTKGQWQAERDRQKGGEWKRHRGRKIPVSAESVVDVKLDTGEVMSGEIAGDWEWSHTDAVPRIMQYRIISQPQAEEVEVKDTTIGTLSYKVEIDTTEASQAIDDLAAKWDQIDGPMLWRDTVNELDAYIEKYTRERDALIERLASEGFALIPPVVSVVPEFSGVDMSDWRNWKAGDIVVCAENYNKQFTQGKKYELSGLDKDERYPRVQIKADDMGEGNGWGAERFKFHSRP